MKAALLPLALLPLLALACSRDVPLGGTYEPALIVAPEPIRDLDILFVVDNSASMTPHQHALVEAAGDSLFAQLADEMGEVPDLHVGVVSTDMGVGPHSLGGCTDSDDGRLQHAPRLPGCEPPEGAFLIDVDDGAGGRTRNFTGELGDAFSCIAQLGVDGCGFEQPMAAMRRALDGTQPDNDGFLRPEAALLIVFVGDEDDCSASNPALFDPSVNEIGSELGPLASFRCTDHGIVCDEDLREPGVKTNCRPRDDGEYLIPVGEFVEFLRGVKPDPTMVMVAGIFGDPSHVEVSLDASGRPQLVSSSPTPPDPTPDAAPPPPDAGGDAGVPVADAGVAEPPPATECPADSRMDPGIRLAALAAEFPTRYSISWLCQQSMQRQLADIAGLAGRVMSGSTCMPAVHSPTCRAFEATGLQTDAETRHELRACGAGGPGPCFAIVEDAARCPHTPARRAVELRDGALAPGAHLLVECLAPSAP